MTSASLHWTSRLRASLYDGRISQFIIVVIIINSITLGVETFDGWLAANPAIHSLLKGIDRLCLTVFVVEILAKLALDRERFFRSGWNIFDLLVVGIALLPSSGPLSILRVLRVLRLLRLFSAIPSLRRIVEAIFRSLPSMASVIVLLGIIFYAFGVLATELFGDFQDPAYAETAYFGNLWDSLYSLFQVMTLESWSHGMIRPLMREQAWAGLFFIAFIIITGFGMLNLFIGVIVASLEDAREAERAEEKDKLAEEIAELRRAVDALARR